MRARLVFLATLGIASLAACGGGGSGGGGAVTPPATPTPSPTPSNDDSRPATTGDTFAYAGTMSVAFVRPPQTTGVIPSPNPGSSQTLSYTTVQTQSVTTGETYNGAASAVLFATSETDTLLGGLETSLSSSSEFYAFEPMGSSTLVHDLGGSTSTEGGDSFATLVGPNNGVVDVLPEVAGSISVPADATLSLSEHDADGQTDVRLTNADGTYTENIAYVDQTTATAVANADGSGSFSFPIGYQDNAVFGVAAPVPASSTAPVATIPITITYPAGVVVTPNTTPTPTVVTRTVNAWYPQPLVLSTKSLVDRGSTAIPAACGVASALLRSSSNALVATSATVDPVFGELDTRTTTQYTEPGVGVACVQLQDVLQQFYDFSEQTGQYVATSSAPVQTTTTLETLGLTSEKIIGLSSVARDAIVGASRAHFASVLDRKRARRHAQIAHALRAALAPHAGGRI